MPIGHLQQDFENIIRIVDETSAHSIKLILVLDNQSKESQDRLIEKLKFSGSTNFQVVSGSWGNPGGARNFGITFCKSDWIAFWDSDDIPDLNGIRRLVADMRKSRCDLGIGIFSFFRKGILSSETGRENDEVSLEKRMFANPGLWRFIFSTKYIKGISFPENLCSEDILFLQRVFARLPRINLSKYHTYTYVQGGLNQITKSPFIVDDIMAVLRISVEELSDKSNEQPAICASLVYKQVFSAIKRGSALQKFQTLIILGTVIKKNGIVNFFGKFYYLIYLKFIRVQNG
jgi:glycosyltransferase involved in cell wall biosynthesis